MPTSSPVWSHQVKRIGHDVQRPASRISAEQLPGLLRTGETVVVGHGGGWPRRCVEALATGTAVPVRMVHNRIDDELPYFRDGSLMRHVGLMVARHTRDAVASGRADYVPNSYGDTPTLLRGPALRCDVVILHVSTPDRDGWCSLGTCVAYLPAAVESARIVVAQINPQMPRTFGTAIHMSALDYVVDVDDPLQSVAVAEPSAIIEAIASHVAGQIHDDDVIQVGIGKLGDAILRKLSGRRRLRLWTETFSDAAVDLLDDGTLCMGPAGQPAIAATFVTGSQHLYRALHENPAVAMLPVDQTNGPESLAATPCLVAVNSAIEIDLTGQVNAESIGEIVYSGTGGHLDFAVGANRSPGGRYICALPSTAGEVSRIVARLGLGAGVTVPRSLAGTVVTEFGAVDLRGRTLQERAAALIEIAHPDHREELRRAARYLPAVSGVR